MALKSFLSARMPRVFQAIQSGIWWQPAPIMAAYVDGTPIRRRPKDRYEVLSSDAISDALSKDLKNGDELCWFTICYAYMQAVGLIDEHLESCHQL